MPAQLVARFAEDVALGLSVLAALVLLGWVLMSCRAGFDFTDEGFYLNWISSPQDYPASVTEFGFVYHPLYRLLGSNIVLLRQTNILIIFGTAFALCLALLRTSLQGHDDPWWAAPALALVMATGSLDFLHVWLSTPGYNSLTFVSVMLAAIGVTLTRRTSSNSGVVCWILIGAGGALTFLGKPTSAALLAGAVAAYLLVAGKLRARSLLICVLAAASVLLASALAIDGSALRFVERLRLGLQVVNHLLSDGGSKNLFRLDDFAFGPYLKDHFALVLAFAFVTVFLVTIENAAARLLAAIFAIVFAGTSIDLVTGTSIDVVRGTIVPSNFDLSISYEAYQPMLFWAISIAITLTLLLMPKRLYAHSSRSSVALALFLIGLPYVYVFGTGTRYIEQGARVGFLGLLGVLVIFIDVVEGKGVLRRLAPVMALALLVPVIALYGSINEPYRQIHALGSQTTEVRIVRGNARLLLDAETAAYVTDLERAAAEGGFHLGDNVIDLSGVSPGAVYLIGGRAPGAPWLSTGYPGSSAYLQASLDLAGCNAIARSWILTEPGSRSTFSFDLLRRYGIDVSRDYREVGTVHGVRAFAPQKFEQRLLKPTRDAADALEACEREKRLLRASDAGSTGSGD
jgi:hypothetical protein